MKRLAVLLAVLLVVGLSFLWFSEEESAPPESPDLVSTTSNLNESIKESIRDREIPSGGPEFAEWYFEDWHNPYGAVLDRSFVDDTWDAIRALPEEDGDRAVNAWESIGPYGMTNAGGGLFTGRVLDIDMRHSSSLRVAAATGGLWSYYIIFPYPMTEGITSQVIGTFSTDPTDENTILIGTGEPRKHAGTGLWKTTDAGTSWYQVPMSPEPGSFFRVRHAPDGNTVYAATWSGFYRSTDGGESWTRTRAGAASDLVFEPGNPSNIYVTFWGEGLFKSINDGQSWFQMTGTGLPTSGMNRGAVAICTSNINVIYVAFADTNDELLGVYRTVNGGTSWSNVSPIGNYMGGQGWYNNIVGVSPVDPDVALVGGVTLWRTTNGGSEWSWEQIESPHLHCDYHAIQWHNDGQQIWIGHDGGWSFSGDAGLTWDSTFNVLPITQYVNVHAGGNNVDVIGGGSQDNGISVTTDGGVAWRYASGGSGADGSGFCIDPNDASRMWCTCGVYPGDWAWVPFRSTDYGVNWAPITNGIDPSPTWFTRIRNDQVNPVYLYMNSGPWIYESINYGDSWTKLNPAGFPAYPRDVQVSRYASPKAVVYAPLAPPAVGQMLRVYDTDGWYERSTGLPAGMEVRRVDPHPTDSNKGYALINGLGSPGQKVFRTTNRGQTWVNVTGNLPNVPMGGLVAHPTDDNKLYLGTEFGCYRTTNGGANWHRWNYGLAEATMVTEMTYIDLRTQTGEFYVVAGTYGRSIWKREVTGDDPVSDISPIDGIAGGFRLRQNMPNPFTSTTTIEFALPKPEQVTVEVFDTAGRRIRSLADEKMAAGVHRFSFDGENLAAGVYFCRVTAGTYHDTKQMVLSR